MTEACSQLYHATHSLRLPRYARRESSRGKVRETKTFRNHFLRQTLHLRALIMYQLLQTALSWDTFMTYGRNSLALTLEDNEAQVLKPQTYATNVFRISFLTSNKSGRVVVELPSTWLQGKAFERTSWAIGYKMVCTLDSSVYVRVAR